MLAQKLLGAMAGGEEKLYSDDVFSAYTYTGNGSTQTINNGIDLAGKGGMVWVKDRSQAAQHNLIDTVRGVGRPLDSSSIYGQGIGYPYTVQSTGFTANHGQINANTVTYVSWTFRKAPKFFDVVTWTGSGVDGQVISHSLGVTPGAIIIKRTDAVSGWATDFRHAGGRYHGLLNTTDACDSGGNPAAVTMTNGYTAFVGGTDFALYAGSTGRSNVNVSGGTYVAYLFAHDTSADGIVQCGSFTTDMYGELPNHILGWEPQYLMVKASSGVGSWSISDICRGMPGYKNSGSSLVLYANTSAAEAVANTYWPTSTGFGGTNLSASATYIYLAIRRPNKPPTTGTQVYNAIARTGTGAAATVTGVGFAPDLCITKKRSVTTLTGARFTDRLRGKTIHLDSTATTAEVTTADTVTGFDVMDGFVLGADASTSAFNTSTHTYVNHFFKRAPGVFDVVCWKGDGNSATLIDHSLTVVPELVIEKSRSAASIWYVYNGATYGQLNTNAVWYSFVLPLTSTTFSTANGFSSGVTNVTYLFATKAGISKVGSYTGNGASQTINCGFTTGSRFVLIKRTDAAGDWYVWDTVRGIVAGNDPHLSLNTTAAEVTTDDSIDPDVSGFIVNQLAATNINVNGASYIVLAYA